MSYSATILQRIKDDHDRHRQMLDVVADTTGDSEERKLTFVELTKELKGHAAAEEQSLYAEMLAEPDVNDPTRHSVAEHHEIDEMLNDLAATDMSSSGWLQKFKSFDDRYRHHINEEEEDHFPDFEKKIDSDLDSKMTRIYDDRLVAERESAKIEPEKKENAKA
ncbi:hemerythrin domain-containing protein [Qipengyuania nanhaisediminis]|uniref:hemerythrin domain-containing protein n=1 Tax=Qipengyuania nanhaisediminis TaxID=604088 RepID=UPI0038B278C5